MPVLGTKLLKGMGFGNQLFAVIAARCLAEKNGMGYSVLSAELLEHNLDYTFRSWMRESISRTRSTT